MDDLKIKTIQLNSDQLAFFIKAFETYAKLGESSKLSFIVGGESDSLCLLSGNRNALRITKFDLNKYSTNYTKESTKEIYSSSLIMNKEVIKIFNFIKKSMKKDLLNFNLHYSQDSKEIHYVGLELDSASHKFKYNLNLSYSEYFPIDNGKMINFLNWQNLSQKDLYSSITFNEDQIDDLLESIDIIKTTRAGDDDNVLTILVDNNTISVQEEKIKSHITFKDLNITSYKNESLSIQIKIDDFLKINDLLNKFTLKDKSYLKMNIYKNTILLTYTDEFDSSNIDNVILSCVIK